MNLVRYGSHRDKEIIDLIEEHNALSTDQIACLKFPFKTGHLKAQTRLLKLYQRKRVKRVRLSLDTPYIYFLGQKSGRLEHLIGVNWIYTWLMSRLESWESLYHWEYEQDYGIVQADAFCGIKNNVTNEIEWLFLEYDRAESSKNKFDKVSKYNELYELDALLHKWWYKKANRFPKIVVVTENEKKLAKINQLIEQENANNLRFEVHLITDIMKEAKTCKG